MRLCDFLTKSGASFPRLSSDDVYDKCKINDIVVVCIQEYVISRKEVRVRCLIRTLFDVAGAVVNLRFKPTAASISLSFLSLRNLEFDFQYLLEISDGAKKRRTIPKKEQKNREKQEE